MEIYEIHYNASLVAPQTTKSAPNIIQTLRNERSVHLRSLFRTFYLPEKLQFHFHSGIPYHTS